MSSKRVKPKVLTQVEIDRVMAAATALHIECCRPLLRTNSDHYRALDDLNEQIVKTIREITGEDPPWMRRSNS